MAISALKEASKPPFGSDSKEHQRSVRISVRALVLHGEQRGDLNSRFSSRSNALAGIRGHQRLQRRRGADYVAEKTVRDRITRGETTLVVSGRADGYFPDASPLIVEEVKTVRGDATRIPEDQRRIHLGQVKVYAFLLGREAGCKKVCVRLCYLQLDDDSEVLVEEVMTINALRAYYDGLVRRYFEWDQAMARRQSARDKSIIALTPPYGGFRAGQREMAVSVWRTLQQSAETLIEAPTGVGKTMAALYPAITALKHLEYDKVFFLTAKSSGQENARRAVADLRAQGLQLTDITLTAKEKVCFNPGVPCHPDHCEYAKGYYDRLEMARQEVLLTDQSLSPETISDIARAQRLCPFELSLDLALIADVVIADYNYLFDPWVYLRRFFDEEEERYILLVDEAHNLVDRGRDMLSVQLDRTRIVELRRRLRDEAPVLARQLSSINDALLAERRNHRDFFAQSPSERKPAVLDTGPTRLSKAIDRFCETAEPWLAEHADEVLLSCYFDLLRFARLSDMADENDRWVMSDDGSIRIININPAKGLRAGFDRGHASIAFSATLKPTSYFRVLLGLKEESCWYRVASPFPPEHLGTYIVPFVSTNYWDRERTLDQLTDVLATALAGRSGNYLAFFPSYRYLELAYARFRQRYPDIHCVCQRRSMTTAETRELLALFDEDSKETLLGFAVMGGAISEGIDLVGERLIGALVVGVGLPALSVERDLIAEIDVNDRSGGFEFAYQYPGLVRVIQTAGRVIRSSQDRGIVCLIDRRFAQPGWRQHLPNDWQVTETRSCQSLSSAVNGFWNGDDDDRPDGHPGSHAGRHGKGVQHRDDGGADVRELQGSARAPAADQSDNCRDDCTDSF